MHGFTYSPPKPKMYRSNPFSVFIAFKWLSLQSLKSKKSLLFHFSNWLFATKRIDKNFHPKSRIQQTNNFTCLSSFAAFFILFFPLIKYCCDWKATKEIAKIIWCKYHYLFFFLTRQKKREEINKR